MRIHLLVIFVLSACQAPVQIATENPIRPKINTIYWSDGDQAAPLLMTGF